MKWIWFWFGLVFQVANAQNPVFHCTNGQVRFVSSAPLERIEAESKELRGIIDPEGGKYGFTIDINTFQGFNSPLQRDHFNENYLESSVYPKAQFAGKIIENIDFNQNGEYTIRAKGKLNIHGIAKERIIKSSVKVENGQIHLFSHFTVLLEDYQITIPRIVYQKIAEEIDVYVEAQLSLKTL